MLITGGAGGIGQATAQLFLGNGAKVVLVDVDQEVLAQAKSNLNADKDALETAEHGVRVN